MSDYEKRARFGEREYSLEDVVRHVSGGDDIVLCRTESGELSYATAIEWRAASVSSDAAPTPSPKATEKAIVTQDSPIAEKVDLVMSLFRGRSDVYAEGYEGRTTKPGKLSYWPRCSLRWTRGACPRLNNPKARCRDCDHPSYAPLTHDVVKAHCMGRRDRRGRIQAIGIYVVDGDVCHLLAADFDGPGWQDAASAYRDACRRHSLSPAVERSRSGNGAHVWVFFEGPVKASLARRLGEGLVSEARDTCAAVSFRSYDRLFPLQDSVSEGDLGSLIALPLQGEAVRKGNSVFVDDQFDALPDQCAYLSTLPKANAESVAALANEFGKDPVGLPEGTSRRIAPPKPDASKTPSPADHTAQSVPSESGADAQRHTRSWATRWRARRT